MASGTPATPMASATPTHGLFKTPIIVFFVVAGGILGLCILAAIFLPLFNAYRRRQARNNTLAISSDNEKGRGSDTWLPTHDRQTSDGQVPLLTTTNSRFSDASLRKPHYRLISESRPLQPVDYVVDIGARRNSQVDSEDEDEEGRSQSSPRHDNNPRVPFPIPIPIPLPSPMSQTETFIVKPEDPPTPTRRVAELPVEPSNTALRAVEAQAQKSSAPGDEITNAAVSRSSTLSTASLYSQKSIPSPIQETATTPSVSAFPLPPPTSPREQRLSRERQAEQMTQRSNSVIVSHLLQERARLPSLVPAVPPRSPNRPTTRDSDTSTSTVKVI